jgi:hypothetical protein
MSRVTIAAADGDLSRVIAIAAKLDGYVAIGPWKLQVHPEREESELPVNAGLVGLVM